MKQLKLLVTLPLIPTALIPTTLTSCGNNISPLELKSRINRVQYTKITGEDCALKAHSILDSIWRSQTEELYLNGPRRLIIPTQGSINTVAEFTANGSITVDEISMKDFNVSSKTNYGFAWDKEKKFIEFRGNDKSWYVLQEAPNTFWCAFTYYIDGKETKGRSRLFIDDEQFDNEYLPKHLDNRGTFTDELHLGLSGLGYLSEKYLVDEDKKTSISDIFHDGSGLLYQMYSIFGQNAGEGHDFACEVASNNSDTFSGNLVAHLDLATLSQNLQNKLTPEEKEIIKMIYGPFAATGLLNFDFFAAWKNNYISQQEYMLKAQDLYFANAYNSQYLEIKASNLDLYFNEEVTLTYDISDKKINEILSEYKIIY